VEINGVSGSTCIPVRHGGIRHLLIHVRVKSMAFCGERPPGHGYPEPKSPRQREHRGSGAHEIAVCHAMVPPNPRETLDSFPVMRPNKKEQEVGSLKEPCMVETKFNMEGPKLESCQSERGNNERRLQTDRSIRFGQKMGTRLYTKTIPKRGETEKWGIVPMSGRIILPQRGVTSGETLGEMSSGMSSH